ncbi:cysteine protease C11 family [Firmicutes bacterium CAG:24]|nr:cysteine protease C11 family [Firmicutes bacterium CAG:24]
MKKLGKLLRNLLIICGVLFIIALLLPDEEEMPADQEQTSVETASGIGTQTGTETASGAETLAGAEHVAGAAENSFPEDMVKEKQTEIKGDGKDQATVFVYMNGSDLESEDGEATEDLCEMLAANISSQVNVLVETIGTKSWSKRLGIASDHTQRYKVEAGNLMLVDDSLGQLDCTSPDTLADFISWGAENYPANRYILIFWDHGAGPVYGFGYDEHQSEDSVLTIDEIQTAIRQSGIYFDIIGMDSCIMSSLELCCAMYNYCDYMILSEDFESGYGWSYTGWLNALSENSSISSEELGKIIVDDMIADNEENGEGASTLALIDESYMKVLYTAWADFAYANEPALLGENYSMHVRGGRRAHPVLRKKGLFDFLFDEDGDYSMSDYYITDIMAVAQNIESKEAEALAAAVNLSICYFNCTDDEVGMTGLSVTLPYGDSEFYGYLYPVFTGVGMDADYVGWLEKFVYAEGYNDYYDYESWYEDDWEGWDNYEDDWDWIDWLFFEDDDYWEDDSWDEWGSDQSWTEFGNGRSDCLMKQIAC